MKLSEFFRRWKRGIEGITPVQQAKMQFYSTWIVIVGVILGIVFCLLALTNLWWLLIVLIGALFNTTTIQIGNYQKYQTLKRLSDYYKEVTIDEQARLY